MRKSWVILILFVGLILGATPAVAIPIAIDNHSFEIPALDDDWASAAVPYWSIHGYGSGTSTHTWNPPWYPLNQFEIDGSNVLSAFGNEYTSQTLTDTLAADTLYTLSVQVGNVRSSYGGGEYFWGGYAVQLWAGNTLLAQDDNSLHPDPSHFLTSTVTYHASANDALLGSQLQIRLMSLGDQSNFMAFDKVQLDAASVPVPEPASLFLFGVGFLGLAGARKKPRRH